MNLALKCWFSQCYNIRILTAKLSPYYFTYLLFNLHFIIEKLQDLLQMIRLFISEWDERCDWLQTTAKHDVIWSIILCTLEQRMAVSCEISRADQCIFGLCSWLSTRSSIATCQTWTTAAWLLDNCNRLVDSLKQTVDASNFPTIVRKFTQYPSWTIPFWQIETLQHNLIFCEIFLILFNFFTDI